MLTPTLPGDPSYLHTHTQTHMQLAWRMGIGWHRHQENNPQMLRMLAGCEGRRGRFPHLICPRVAVAVAFDWSLHLAPLLLLPLTTTEARPKKGASDG